MLVLLVVVGTTPTTSVSVSTKSKLVVVSTPTIAVVVGTKAVVVGTKAVVVGTKAVVVNRVLVVAARPVDRAGMVDRVWMARVAPRALVDWETMMVSPSCEAG